MPRHNLLNVILGYFSDERVRSLEDVVRHIQDQYPVVSETDLKSAILGLLRRGDLALTDEFNLMLREASIAA